MCKVRRFRSKCFALFKTKKKYSKKTKQRLMKKIILFVVMYLITLNLQDIVAQDHKNHIYFRAGTNSSTIGSNGFKPFFGQNRVVRSRYEPGFLISTGMDFQLNHVFRIGPELNYLRETGTIYHSGHEIGSVRIFSMTEKWSSHQLQIPLLLRWERPMGRLLFGLYAGPALSFVLHGDRTNSAGQVYDYDLEEDVPNPEDYHLFYERKQDVSLIAGGELAFQTPRGDFILEGRATRGFVNFTQEKNFSFHQQSFAILFGYRINIGPLPMVEL